MRKYQDDQSLSCKQSMVYVAEESQGIRSVQMSESEENRLNMAFIADDSKDIKSASISISEADSISGISRINSNNSHPVSPFLGFLPELGNMSEWYESPDIFQKRVQKNQRKRNSMQEISEENASIIEEERSIEKMCKCSKKRLNEKMKVVTVKTSPVKVSKILSKIKGDPVAKIANSNNDDSSSEELRKIVAQIGSKEESKPEQANG